MSYPIEKTIHQHIPLSLAMDFHIEKLSRQEILVTAPMQANTNIHGTGFAGSIYALGVLSAWGLIKYCQDEAGLDAELVIAKANIQYKKPIVDEIVCACQLSQNNEQLYLEQLKKHHKAKIILNVSCGKNSEARLEAHMYARL